MDDPSLRPFAADDLEWIVDRHARLYAEEAGFDATFADAVRAVAESFVARADPRERGFVAMADGRPVGNILSNRIDDETGQIRLFLVEPDWRGTGLAPRMLAEAEGWAREQGCRRMKLWTHESHLAACALYARSGWRPEERTPITSYGQPLVEMVWSKAL